MSVRSDTPGPSAPRAEFIRAMRNVASSVTVVTTEGPAGRLGATVSAFTSVSADPPTALVCLRADSRIARAVAGNGCFCVNVLPEGRRDVANRFAGRDDAHVADRFDGIAHSGSPPVLDGATVFTCRVEQSVTSGSHSVIFGRVEAVREATLPPLAYLGGGYHRVVPEDEDMPVALQRVGGGHG